LDWLIVVTAIKLNDDPLFMTSEVDKERTNGRLTWKMR
jgi:hypothetical protein